MRHLKPLVRVGLVGLLFMAVLVVGTQPSNGFAGASHTAGFTSSDASTSSLPDESHESSAEPNPRLTSDDLANVSLRQEDLGSEYGDLSALADTAVGPEGLVDPTCAPVTADAVAHSEWKGGYFRVYASPAGKEWAESNTPASAGEFLIAHSSLLLLGDDTQASDVFAGLVSDLRPHVCGNETWGGHQFEQFNPPTICDASAGVVLSGSRAGTQWTHTEVMIRRGALVVRASVGRYGFNSPSNSETINLAQRLCDRIDFVSSQEDRKVIFIQGIDSASGSCGSTFRSEYSWMVDSLLESPFVESAAPTLDSENDFFYFSYSGKYCPLGGPPDYARPQYQESDTCNGVSGTSGGAEKLQAMVQGLLTKYPRAHFDIFAHSMGGMVASYWLSQHPERAALVNSVTTLDSPLRGTADKTPRKVGPLPGTVCDHESNAWRNLYCEEWSRFHEDGSNDECQSSVVWPIRYVAAGGEPPDVPFYTIDSTQKGVIGVWEEVPQDRTTLLLSNSTAHCKFDDDHTSVWKNSDLGGNEPIECWDNFRWPDNLQTDPPDPRIVEPFVRAEVKGRFIACGIRGLSGTACIDSLGSTLMSDATIDVWAPAGSTQVALAGGDTISEGDYVVINPGMSNEETKQVTALGSLIFDDVLAFAHQPGERIFRLDSTSFEAKQGDADCDNRMTTADLLAVLRAAGNFGESAGCVQTANVDCNSAIDALDALGLLRYLAALADRPVIGCTAIGSHY